MPKKPTDAATTAEASTITAGTDPALDAGQVAVEAGPVEDPVIPDRPLAAIRCLRPSPWGPVGHERNDVPADWAADAALDGTIELI